MVPCSCQSPLAVAFPHEGGLKSHMGQEPIMKKSSTNLKVGVLLWRSQKSFSGFSSEASATWLFSNNCFWHDPNLVKLPNFPYIGKSSPGRGAVRRANSAWSWGGGHGDLFRVDEISSPLRGDHGLKSIAI